MVPARLPATPALPQPWPSTWLSRHGTWRRCPPPSIMSVLPAVASRANGLAGAVRPRRPATRADRAGARGQGAVGNLAVQLAREAGARIVGTGRGRDRAATLAG